ncbi:MAG: cytochrome c oxidase subunit II [Beijerinckiaceae bacterium]
MMTGLMTGPAMAGVGQPTDWQIGLQEPVTALARDMYDFHTALNWLIGLITLFVLALLIIVIVRFGEKKNPVPSKTTHSTTLEIAWTLLPILILLGVSIPSFRLLRAQLVLPPADVVVKATGKQWFWSYEYPKDQNGGFGFDATMLSDEDINKAVKEGKKPEDMPRLLAVDNEVVVPVNKVIHLHVTAADVIHNFALPSFGVKIDAIPGRMNQTWFKAEREGIYYGQCSRLCGANHAYMPIAIRVVSEQAYAAWLQDAKKKYASIDAEPARLASAASVGIR